MGDSINRRTIAYPGCDLTPAEVEFGSAMDRWRRRNRRSPDCADVLAVAKGLGYVMSDDADIFTDIGGEG